MGVPRLKKKTELNYRHGYTARHCMVCDHFRAKIDPGVTTYFMCEIMGLNTGRSYSIHPKYICDAFDNTERLKRIMGKE
jgi:hypothetical protein